MKNTRALSFSEMYLQVREKEGRVYRDEVLRKLPFTDADHPLHQEWQIRSRSADRIKNYLIDKNKVLNILEVGCGNGWISNYLLQVPDSIVLGVDINDVELEQAARVFTDSRISFLNANVMDDELPAQKFDIIILAASVQYFPDLSGLLGKLMQYLDQNGEIHIIDSPFYKANEIEGAQRRTIEYYRSLDFPEMAKYYFHHSREEISLFDPALLYDPNSFLNRIVRKIFSKPDSPFPWFKIVKKDLF